MATTRKTPPADKAALRGEWLPKEEARAAVADVANAEEFEMLLQMIEEARVRAFRAVNWELIDLYWKIGHHISEKVKSNAWGKGVVKQFAEFVQKRYVGIKGFSAQNIWRMKQFYEAYSANEKLSTLLREISWSNNILILVAAKTDEAKEFYINKTIKYNYSARELERQLDAMLFERTMLSNEKNKLVLAKHEGLQLLRDNYVLELLNISENFYLEALDRDVRKPNENPNVGLVLCTSKDDTVVEYAMSRSLSSALIADYKLHLPDKSLLESKLREIQELNSDSN
jgi:predicted nuclease of restriction endonuclease-like (RecB) superfamily